MVSYVIRSISFIFAVIYTVFSLSAGGGVTEAEGLNVMGYSADSQLKPEARTVSILQSMDEISQYLQQATDMYASANGKVKFSVRTVPNVSDYRTALRASLLSGEKIDIFHIFGYRDMMDLRPCLEDLSALEWIHDAHPVTLDAVSIGGSVYGAPYSIDGIGLIINSSIFTKAGIYVGDILTLEALEELFDKLQKVIDSGSLSEDFPNLEAVTEFAAQDKAYIGSVFSNVAASGSFMAPSAAANAGYIEMPEIVEAGEFLNVMALYSSCTKWSQLNGVTRIRQIEDGIASERVAVILDGVECYRRVSAANPGLEEYLRLLPVPLGGEKDPKKYAYVGAPAYWALNISSEASLKGEAKNFLAWLYKSDSGAALLANRFKAASPYRDTGMDTGIRLHSQLLKQIEDGNCLPMLQSEFPSGWGEETLASCVNQYLTHDITWEELARQSKEDWHRFRIPGN